MSTKDLLDKIEATSKESIAKVETEAAATVEAINAAAEAEVAKIVTDATAAADKAAAAVERAALAKARQAGKLIVQTAKRTAFDDVMKTVETVVVAGDQAKAQAFADKRPDLEMHLSKQLG